MADAAQPIPAHKMAESLARMYGAHRAIVILDFQEGVRTAVSHSMNVRDGIYMLSCATHAMMESEQTSSPQEAPTDPCQSS